MNYQTVMPTLWRPDAVNGIISAYEKLSRNANCREHGRYFSGVTSMDTIPQTSGIYQILCVPTGKVYIGSAISLYQRWKSHRHKLMYGEHDNRYLQNAWSKYGADAFAFTIIELVLASFLLEREQYWLDKTRCYDRGIGFNLYKTAGSPFGMKHSAETRQKMSDHSPRQSRPVTPEARAKISESARRRMADPERRAAVSKVHKGKVISPEQKAKWSAIAKGRPRPAAAKKGITGHNARDYIITSPDGTVYDVHNLSAFCSEHNLNRRTMSQRAEKAVKRSRDGWLCCYK